jgi:hypothetical protein
MKMDTVSTKPLSCTVESLLRSAEPLPRPTELESRAAQALTALLGRVSAIKLEEMKFQSWPRGSNSGAGSRRVQPRPIQTSRILARQILAHIDVHGHRHTLACEVYPDGDPVRLRAALRKSHVSVASVHSDATPILIAPYLSPEAQDLCKQSKAGFLDFEGNARLIVGEVFIVMRSLPGNSASPRNSALLRNSAVEQLAALHASPALSVPVSIMPSALPVSSALPAVSRNRVGSVAIPA